MLFVVAVLPLLCTGVKFTADVVVPAVRSVIAAKKASKGGQTEYTRPSTRPAWTEDQIESFKNRGSWPLVLDGIQQGKVLDSVAQMKT